MMVTYMPQQNFQLDYFVLCKASEYKNLASSLQNDFRKLRVFAITTFLINTKNVYRRVRGGGGGCTKRVNASLTKDIGFTRFGLF